jgi:acyl-homoserine-lactone acylase
MTRRTYEIDVLGEDGETTRVSREMYRTHHGPVLNVPGFGWSSALVASYRDANAANFGVLPQFLGMDKANSLDEFKELMNDVHGIPWVHTIATDRSGSVFYTDASAVPNLSQAALDGWQEKIDNNDVFTRTAADSGIFLFDGTDSLNEWVEVPGTLPPGTVPFADAPQLERRDYVQNSNDNHWITNPNALLEGFSPLYGEETVALSRTLMGLSLLEEEGETSPAGEDGLFTLDELEQSFFSGRTFIAETAIEEVVARCTGAPPVTVRGQEVSIEEACQTLAVWDGSFKIDSVGAVVWREFLALFEGRILESGVFFQQGFDPDQRTTTPNTILAAPDEGLDPVHRALALALLELQGAGFDHTTPLGEAQYTLKGDERIPIPGGTDREGAFNVVRYSGAELRDNPAGLPRIQPGARLNSSTGLFEEGYVINEGASFIMFMSFKNSGPEARAVMSYSQSSDPQSPYFADQTRLFSEEQTRAILFTEDEINNDPNLETVIISSP